VVALNLDQSFTHTLTVLLHLFSNNIYTNFNRNCIQSPSPPWSTILRCPRVIHSTHCNALQHTTIHRNRPQHSISPSLLCSTFTHCDTLQHTVTHRNTPQHAISPSSLCFTFTQTHCNTTQHTATHRNMPLCHITVLYFHALQHNATHCNTLQHTATHCNIMQHTTTKRNALQHFATHRNIS